MKIVILDAKCANPGDLSWDGIAAFGELTVYDRTPETLIVPRTRGCQVAFTNKTPFTRQTMEALPELKMIGVLATGYNIVDVEAARALGITVTNIPAYSTQAVAQLTTALLLEICSQVGLHSQACREGAWTRSPDFSFTLAPLTELAGKTFGIVGFGRIGRAVAGVMAALGMQVLVYTRHPDRTEHVTFTDLDTLLARSDVLSLHCPLTAENAGLICRQTIAKMKDGAILLNTARGGLLCESDVAEALARGKLRALGADVVSAEPIAADNPLLSAPNVYLTPHIAWAPQETRRRLLSIAEDNLRAFAEGHPIHVVS